MTDRMTYEEAKKRVQEIRGFFWHLFTFLIMNVFLFALNWLKSPGHWWFFWPFIGWGIGLAFHGAWVFIEIVPFGKAWEERKIREMMGERDPGDR